MGKGTNGRIPLKWIMGERHKKPDPIELSNGKEAQRAGSHVNELWEKGTAGRIPLNLIMRKKQRRPDPIEINYGKKVQRAGSH